MILAPWWERWPGLLDEELRALREANIDFEIDREQRAKGVIVLHLRMPLEDRVLELAAIYPHFYPYFRFEVHARNLQLRRHQNPFQGNLCLIGRSTEYWRPGDRLGPFLRDRVPRLLESVQTSDAARAAELEEDQGEPFSAYYSYKEGAVVLVDSSLVVPPSVPSGQLVLGLAPTSRVERLRAALLEVRDEAGQELARTESAMFELYGTRITARWCRVPEAIRAQHGPAFLAQLPKEELPRLDRAWDYHASSERKVAILGVLFPEEIVRGRQGDSWVFLVKDRAASREWKKSGKGSPEPAYLVRGARAGRQDFAERIPTLRGLSSQRVAVFGLGALGAPSAIELARNGVRELRILDFDIVAPAASVRWPLGLEFAGSPKTGALKDFLARNYPYTLVRVWPTRLGAEPGDALPDGQAVAEMLDGADLVYDATAEPGINYFLSDIAREQGVPYVLVSATQGAWGGIVARVSADPSAACWFCLERAWAAKSIPVPPEEPVPSVQPPGCADLTFTGPSFDLLPIAHAGVRLAIATLCRGTEAGYPDFSWDVGILALRDSDGRPVAPTWTTATVEKDLECPACRSRASRGYRRPHSAA